MAVLVIIGLQFGEILTDCYGCTTFEVVNTLCLAFFRVGRHTKSLDIVRKICGICKGRFALQDRQNTKKEGLEHNPFAKFVKENYGKHKKPGVKHGEVSSQWLL